MNTKHLMNTNHMEGNEYLSEIKSDSTFRFACGPEMPCFNLCCTDLVLPLTPYDVLRITMHLKIASEDFLNTFTSIHYIPENGFPLPYLRMIEGPDSPCPFVMPFGCSIYEARPGACRAFPLGRGSKISSSYNLSESFFIVREEYCQGLDCGSIWTPEKWLLNENMKKYNYFNDRYMVLISNIASRCAYLSRRLATMTLLCLYQIDKFREFIKKLHIFSRLNISEQKQLLIMQEDLMGNETCLDFAFDWLEIVLSGSKSL